MMNTKFLRIIIPFCLIAILISGSVLTVSGNRRSVTQKDAQYTNPENGYQVMIIDELHLLNSLEQVDLINDMKPVTQYGHAIFWTTDEYDYNEIDQARKKRLALYQYDDAVIFVINMKIRKITIQSYGSIYQSVTDSKARSITDNVSKYASSREYYHCSKEAFEEIFWVMEGKKIDESMKYISCAVISAMAGIIIALSVAFSKRFNPLLREYQSPEIYGTGDTVNGALTMLEFSRETHHVSSSSSGCSGGGGCGGGSSCGGGGGCGGGGSSSF